MRMAWLGYASAVGATLTATLAGFAMRGRFDLVNIAMVYLLAVVLVALYQSRGAAIAASVLCVAAFDVLFVPPEGTFTVHDAQYLLTFAIMLGVGLIVSRLVERVPCGPRCRQIRATFVVCEGCPQRTGRGDRWHARGRAGARRRAWGAVPGRRAPGGAGSRRTRA